QLRRDQEQVAVVEAAMTPALESVIRPNPGQERKNRVIQPGSPLLQERNDRTSPKCLVSSHQLVPDGVLLAALVCPVFQGHPGLPLPILHRLEQAEQSLPTGSFPTLQQATAPLKEEARHHRRDRRGKPRT